MAWSLSRSIEQNDRGICVPIYVKTSDRAEKLYLEAASTRAINRGSLRGKALYHNGRRLDPKELISDLRIAFYDTVRLQSVEEPQSEKDLRQGEEAFPLPKGHEGPIE